MSAPASDARTARLEHRLRRQSDSCATAGSPLTATLLAGAAGELARPGPTRDALLPLADLPRGSAAGLRLAGALHRLVLERRAPALALHYPSVGGTAGPEGVWDDAREVVRDAPELPQLLARSVQTNEVGRSAALLGGLRHVVARTGRPVRLLEIGASGGLNLRVDAFAYRVRGRLLGDASSPVVLDEPWQGGPTLWPPDVDVRVVERLGCDPEPVDPTTTDGRLTLTSYVWPDHPARLERLRGALDVASRVPATVTRAPASVFLARELDAPRPGVVTVVWHSVVEQYLTTDEREVVEGLLADAGARATAEAPLARLVLEPRSGEFGVELTSWPDGGTELLARAQGHGPPVVWG